MRKMAIFVEGQTEQLVVEALVLAIAGSHNIHIDSVRAFGGRLAPRQWVDIQATAPTPNKHYYVMIYDCTGFGRMLSDIRDQYNSLISNGFSEIVGMRDVIQSP